jgi:hypothetical protein
MELKRLHEQIHENIAEIMNNSDTDIDSTFERSPSEGSFKEDDKKSLQNYQMT